MAFRATLMVTLGAALACAGPHAAAERTSGVVRITAPPKEYRSGPSVYGTVSVTFEPDMARMKKELCPSFAFSVGVLMGCVNINEGRGCAIVLWSGLKRAPALRAAVEEHELAHCRGWGSDHAGGRERVFNVGRGFFPPPPTEY